MNYKDQLVRIGPLEALVSESPSPELTFVLFHGYGANAADLFPLLNYIQTNVPTRWVFPEGIEEVPVGPGWTGQAWFPIDMAELERAMMRGAHRDFSNMRPPGLNTARDKASEMLSALEKTEKLIIGGFSQGAMLAMDLLMMTDIEVDAVVQLSGTLLDRSGWGVRGAKRRGLPFFQSHGQNDPLLEFKQAQDLENLLKSLNWSGELLSFNGGHEIPEDIIKKLGQFVSQVVS